MADSRVAYGLAKKYGIETKGMSPGEVWEALKKKGVTPENVDKGAYDSRSDIQSLKVKSNNLTKQELAMFYERIGKIKKEGHYIPKTAKGEMMIPIETEDSNVLIIAKGTYQNPRVKATFRCANNEEMYAIISAWEKKL